MSIPLSRYGRVFDILPEMIFILDGDQQILDHNRAAADQTGYDPEKLDTLTMRDLLPPEKQEALSRLSASCFSGGRRSLIVNVSSFSGSYPV